MIAGTVSVRAETIAKQVGKVAFTFDCAQWGDAGLDHILAVMKKRKITGTFFVTGKFIETNKEGLLKITAAGHEVANHSYEHDKSNSIGECDRVARLFKEATGKEMSRYFRAPYLYEEKISWPYYAQKGWQEGYVSLITCDALPEYKRINDRVFLNNFRHYVKNGSEDRIAIHKTIYKKGPGHINGAAILMHIDGYRYHLLEAMVDIVQRTGYQCATFSEASAARKIGDWFLDPRRAVAPALLTDSASSSPGEAAPAFIKLAEARPDKEKMESARKAFQSDSTEGNETSAGEFSFTFTCHNYSRDGLGTILVVLRRTKTPATFYISEQYFYQVPGAVKQILEHGHEIAYYAKDKEGLRSLSDAHKFAGLFKKETGEELTLLYRTPEIPEEERVRNNFAITDWNNGYYSLDAADTDEKWASVLDGSFLAYFKIYLSIAPVHRVSIMKVPFSGTGNINGGVVAMHPAGNRYHLLQPMIESVREKGYTIVPQSRLKLKRL